MDKRIRILIIDNDPNYCMVMRVALEMEGFSEVFYENNPETAMRAAEAIQPDIILLDMVMHPKSGLELLDELKQDKKTRHIPVIIMTALSSDKARLESSKHFSESYMEKSGNTNDLKRKIVDILHARGYEVDFKDHPTITKKPQESQPTDKPLPAKVEEQQEERPLPIPIEDDAWHRKKILVISDEASEVVSLDTFFVSSGFDFCFYNDLTNVCRVFEIERPDIVIIDIALRKIEGTDIIGRIKRSKIKSKVIVITAIGEAPVVRDLIRRGADDILIKPYSMNQLYAAIVKNLIS